MDQRTTHVYIGWTHDEAKRLVYRCRGASATSPHTQLRSHQQQRPSSHTQPQSTTSPWNLRSDRDPKANHQLHDTSTRHVPNRLINNTLSGAASITSTKVGAAGSLRSRPRNMDLIALLIVAQRGDEGFQKLPAWVQHRLHHGMIRFPRRDATELEQWEANADHVEHRITHNEMNLDDLVNYHTIRRLYNV